MKYLKELRLKKGVSQQAVADYLKITRQAYSNYENGNRSPDNEILLKLAEYFGTSVDVILRGPEKAPTPEGERHVSDAELKAAFFDGYSDELTQEEIDELWADAKDYARFKAEQRMRHKE